MLRRLILLVFVLSAAVSGAGDVSDRVIAFYYGWYGNPATDGRYEHWNSQIFERGNKASSTNFPGGDDIASNYYPQAGPYSVNDRATLDRQMRELRSARVGVLSASWWGDDSFTGRNFSLLLDAAHQHGLKVCIHLEPFGGRNATTTRQAIQRVIERYGEHPAFFRSSLAGGRPLFFIYDSYLTPAVQWAEILSSSGKETIRGTRYDSAVIGLWVKESDGKFMTNGLFDGFYTYFAADRFTYGSSIQNWPKLSSFAREHKLLFLPSVGPGYVDTRVRPWNQNTTRSRNNGEYYDLMFRAAIEQNPAFITITSYNEWHEGTQIEPAVPKEIEAFIYKDYRPLVPDHYLKRTAYWVAQFEQTRP
jgi:alpha-mannan endo-1,2-alpha-mannanase / glycoprotein endo-alpha-1,2-mannosidase